MTKQVLILLILILLLFSVNYKTLDGFLIKTFDNKNEVLVTRVIDGDTIVAGNITIRLLAINSPEKGEKYSIEAKEFLEKIILNKSIILEEKGKDKYQRTLAYIFYQNKNVNLEIVKNGFANFYFPSGKDIYYDNFKTAWENCINNNLNFCKNSDDRCANCMVLKTFDHKNEIIILKNICDFNCDLTSWTIKDEGRKKFAFPNFILKKDKTVEIIVSKDKLEDTNEKLFWIRKDYVWTDSGDTIFLRDFEDNLVLWKNY